jgi:hypothetical protein
MFRNPFVWLIVIAIAVIAGPMYCAGSEGDILSDSEDAPALASLDTREAMISGTGIEGVSPDRVLIDGDRVAPQAFDVSYRMRDLKSIRDAWIQLDIPGAGELTRVGVAVQDSGSVRVEVGSGSPSLGPTVRFRASCANGASAWYTMGQALASSRERSADAGAVRITNVSPPSIARNAAMDPARTGAGQRVVVTGKGVSADCNVEAEVNGSRVELANTRFNGPRFEGLLLFRDLGYSPVARRYLEMKLVVKRSDAPLVAMRKLPFID